MSDASDAEPNRDDDYCYLTTNGRRTGRRHRIEIWYAAEGATIYLLAGGGRSSDWVQNIERDPEVRVELGGDELRGHARVLEGSDDAERARTLVFGKYAARLGRDLTDWRDRALPVAIDVEGA